MAYRPLDLKKSMENKELDPKRFFVFGYPIGLDELDIAFGIKNYFFSDSNEPYAVYNNTDYGKNPFKIQIDSYRLPYKFISELNDKKKEGYWKHTLDSITDLHVNKVFVERALEYYNRPFELFENYEFTLFMGFHYESYRGQLSDFLERIEIIIKTLDGDSSKIYDISSIHLLRLRKQLTLWVNEKRSELNEIDGLEIATVPQTEVREVEEIDPVVFEKVSHKLVYLHEIGVYDFLKDKYKTLYKTPIKFATLLASVMGIVEPKEIENLRKCIGYIETTNKKNPINDLSLKKVRVELLKLGIEKSSN